MSQMTHQEIGSFLIHVVEAGLYETNEFFGYKVKQEYIAWEITPPYPLVYYKDTNEYIPEWRPPIKIKKAPWPN